MACCSCEDDSEQKLKHEGWSDLSEKKRGCTDVLHLVRSCVAVVMMVDCIVTMGVFIRYFLAIDSCNMVCNDDGGFDSARSHQR